MTTLATEKRACSMFHSLKGGTVEQSRAERNSTGNSDGTTSLKSLAQNVLERNSKRNKAGTRAKNSIPKSNKKEPSCSIYSKNEKILDNQIYTESSSKITSMNVLSGYVDCQPVNLAHSCVNISFKKSSQKAKFLRRFTCGSCLEWQSVQGSAYWVGKCALTGQKVDLKQICNVPERINLL